MGDAEEICTEFAKNFRALEIRFASTSQELVETRVQLDKSRKTSDSFQRELFQRENQLQNAKHELDEALQHRERFVAASVTIEHLKGKMEAMRKAVQDKEEDRKLELEQLKQQNADLLARLDTNVDLAAVSALKKQKLELEERCSVLSTQLFEQRERLTQEKQSLQSSLRDCQNRSTELEHRTRALDHEVALMRSSSRKALDMQNESTLERDRAAAELLSLQRQLEVSNSDCLALKRNEAETLARMATQLQEEKQKGLLERERLEVRLREANTTIATLTEERRKDAEKLNAANRSSLERVEAAREESRQELDALNKRIAEQADEVHRLKSRARGVEREREEISATLNEAERRNDLAEKDIVQLRLKFDAASQEVAWINGEKERLQAVTAEQRNQIDHLTTALRQGEELELNLRRYEMKVEALNRDLESAQQELNRQIETKRVLEHNNKKQIAAVKTQLHEFQRFHKSQMKKEAGQKRRLLEVILDMERRASGASELINPTVAAATVDPMAVLKQQEVEFQEFKQRLNEALPSSA